MRTTLPKLTAQSAGRPDVGMAASVASLIHHWRRDRALFTAAFVAAVAGAISQAILTRYPALAIGFFARGAAQVAGLLTECPVIRIDEGWLLPSNTPAVVTTACSGTTYFLLLTLLLGWHVSRAVKRISSAVIFTVGAASIMAIAVNGVRIAAAIQASHWLNPLFPPSYASLLHMAVGAAVFLPALIAINLICEFHGRTGHSRHR